MELKVLDHGFVRFVEAWGHGDAGAADLAYDTDYECGIIEAARQSTQGSFRGWEKDEKLLRFLWENKHASPFEFAGCILEIKAPIFVFREWHRHRTQSYNEMSARYAPLPAENYVPDLPRCMMKQPGNKQAEGVADSAELYEASAEYWRDMLSRAYDRSQDLYEDGLARGIPKELARIILPVGRYSQMRASANLRNWLAFLTLRRHPAAQWEIRQYAEAVGEILKARFPKTWELYDP